jgi:predicted dehydrogenase
MTEPILRILVSGPGLIGKVHAKLIQARADCTVAAIVSRRSEASTAFAADLGVPFFTDINEALEAERVDAAIISSPNACHYTQAMACIRKQIPTLIEKPITPDIQEAKSIVDSAERADVPVLVGDHRMYNPLLEQARQFLGSPMFGKLVAVQGAALFYKPAHYFREGPWRAHAGGGPILINLIHEVGVMRYLCGAIESVFAVDSRNSRGFEVEDTVALTFVFANGALGSFLLSDTAASSKSWEMTTGENSAYPHFPKENCYHFAGTNGSLDFPTLRTRHYPTGTDPSWWRPFKVQELKGDRAKPLERQIAHFVDVARGRTLPKVSARDGYRNMKVLDAIRLSISTRHAVRLDATDY